MKKDHNTLEVAVSVRPPASRKRGRPRRPAEPEPPRIPRVTRLMALAIKFQNLVDRGEVRDYADLARLGYVTRARLTQIMNLLLLAPDIQEDVLGLGRRPSAITERHLRSLVKLVTWDGQRREWMARQQQG
jgi:hypothetical protein